jgi:hypothetical protein
VVYPATFNGGQDLWHLFIEPMQLDVTDLRAGFTGTATVSGAAPGGATWLAASLRGLGSTYVPQLNVYLDLDRPVQVGPMRRADPDGEAVWNLPVPEGLRGRTLWLQAVQYEKPTNVVERTVE